MPRPCYSLAELRSRLNERMTTDGPAKVASAFGVSSGHLRLVVRGLRDPGAKVLAGLSLTKCYHDSPTPTSPSPERDR